MKRTTLNRIELGGIIVFAIIGFCMIFYSSLLSTYIEPKVYNFYLDMKSNQGEVYRVNNFLIYYDFTKQIGNITFDINDNQDIKYFTIDFPSFLEESKTKTKLLKELDYNTFKELDMNNFEVDFVKNPIGQEEYTTYVIFNKNRINLSNTRVIVSFKSSKIEPNGVFTFYHKKIPIGSHQYSIHFNLGDNYYCNNKCFNKDYSLDAEEWMQSSDKDVKIRLNEEKEWHRFKIEANKAGNLFWGNLLNGLGISLLASSLILGFEYVISAISRRFNFSKR